MRKKEKIKVKCLQCGKDLFKHESQVKERNFCSRECRSEWFKGKKSELTKEERVKKWGRKGNLNGNFGKKWDEDAREQLSKKKIEFFKDPLKRYDAGKSNRGKKFSQERIDKCHKHRTRESYVRIHSEETRKVIGDKSKAKFTPEFKEKLRKTKELNGKNIPLDKLDDYKFYSIISNWIEKMFDRIDDEKQIMLLKERGVFNAFTNKKGVVRDHMYMRYSGFNQGVFPEILRHPCNCQIISHGQNISKEYKKDNQTLEELFEEIKNYNKPWKEQEKVLSLIKEYQEGKRYNKQTYINNYYEFTKQ